MEKNENLREIIFEIINNQLRNNTPPETKITYDRLVKDGYDKFEVQQMIGQCLAFEIYDILDQSKPFNNKRYIKNLLALPEEPLQD